MTLGKSLFRPRNAEQVGLQTVNTAGLARGLFSIGVGAPPGESFYWAYDTTLATLGLITPDIAAPTNYNLRCIGACNPPAETAGFFFGRAPPGQDIQFRVREDRRWRVDYNGSFQTSDVGDVAVLNQIYTLEVQVRDKTYEVFIDGQSMQGTDTASNRVTSLEMAIGARIVGMGNIDSRCFGQIYVFEIEDLDTPASTITWEFTKFQESQPASNTILDQNSQNALTQINEPGSPNWYQLAEAPPTLP